MPVDLNSDVGESFGRWTLGDDDAMLAAVTSANVACGFHAGDPSTLRRVCSTAVANGVVIGAQVSYRDLAGFGRRFMDVAPDELTDDVLYQIGALDGIARACGGRVRYVKPHGALYHAVSGHERQAEAVVRAVAEYDPALPVVGLPGSTFLQLAGKTGLAVVREAFADRAYDSTGALVSRRQPGALIVDPDAAAGQAVRLAGAADSICVHSDTPGATVLAARVRQALEAAGLEVKAFAGA